MGDKPQAIILAEQFQQQLIKQDSGAILSMSRRWQAVEGNLTNLIDGIAQQIADMTAAGEAIPAWKLYQMERYQILMAQLQIQMNLYSQSAIGDMMDENAKAQYLAQKHAKAMLASAAAEGSLTVGKQIDLIFDKLNADAAEKIAAIARGGMPLANLLEAAYPLAAEAMTNTLITGAALGWNPRKTAAQMKKGMNQGFNHILLVARDQQIRNYRETSRQAYDKSGLVYGYMRVASKSRRTCLACLALDGTVYATSELMALHPQDRCPMIPLVKGVPPPQFETGLAWFQKQPGGYLAK